MIRSQEEHSAASVARYFRRTKSTLPYLFRTLSLIWRAAPTWTAVWMVLLLVQGFLPVAVVYLTRPLVNGIAAGIASGGDWSPVLRPALLIAAALVLGELLREATKSVQAVQSDSSRTISPRSFRTSLFKRTSPSTNRRNFTIISIEHEKRQATGPSRC
jgi:ABC-type multidrug transport system fused ATPase/permease subunit